MHIYHSPEDMGIFAEENEYDFEDFENDISELLRASPSFPGAHYFKEIMHEKKLPKRIAKFKASRNSESDF